MWGEKNVPAWYRPNLKHSFNRTGFQMPPLPKPMGLTRRMSSRFITGDTLLHKFSARSSDKTKSLTRGKTSVEVGEEIQMQTYCWSDMLDQSLWWGQCILVSHSLQWERMIPQEWWSCGWENIWLAQTLQRLFAPSLRFLVPRHWKKGKDISGWSWGCLGRWLAFPSPPLVWSLLPPPSCVCRLASALLLGSPALWRPRIFLRNDCRQHNLIKLLILIN